MMRNHEITIDGTSFQARHGETLLEAALSRGVDLPYDCRAGHCGTCCVRLVSGTVEGGQGAEPGIVHACQCRVSSNAVLERLQTSSVRSVEGELSSLLPLSPDVFEVGIRTERAFPYLEGQYVQVRFNGYPNRPYSFTHPLRASPNSASVWFHVRRFGDGQVTSALGKAILPGHKVTLSGPHGSAHFRPDLNGRLVLVATNTGFAPIWSIAAAALRENPERRMLIITGGRNIQYLYMGSALAQLSHFPNVRIIPVCSTPQTATNAVLLGRPTDFLPRLLPSDVLYACGAPAMVTSIKEIAAQAGATCYADPFVTAAYDRAEESVFSRAVGWLARPTGRQRPEPATDRTRARQTAFARPSQIAATRTNRHSGHRNV